MKLRPLLIAFLSIVLPGMEVLAAGGDVPLPPGAVRRLGSVSMRNGGPILCLAFAPDSKLLATAGCEDGSVHLWDPSTGKEVHKLGGDSKAVQVMAFSPNGKLLATGAKDDSVRIWDPTTGKKLHQLQQRGTVFGVEAMAFSPDNRTVAAADSGIIYLWDAEKGKELIRMQDAQVPGFYKSLAFSADGKLLISGSCHQWLDFWDTASGKNVQRVPTPGGNTGVYALALSSDGKTLAAGCQERRVRLFDAATGKQIREMPAEMFSYVALSPDGKTLAARGKEHRLVLYDCATGKERLRPLHSDDYFRAASFSPDGKRLAAGGDRGIVRLWDAATGKEITPASGHEGAVHSVAFFPDGKRAASASADNSWRIWDLETGKEVIKVTERASNRFIGLPRAMAVSPDGKAVITGNSDASVRLWDAATGKEIRELAPRRDCRLDMKVAFSPDGQLVSAVSYGVGLTTWDGHNHAGTVWTVKEGKRTFELRRPTDFTRAFAMSSDGRSAAWCATHHFTIQNTSSSALKLDVPYQRASWMSLMAFSPDGWLLAMGSKEGVAFQVYERLTGRPLVFRVDRAQPLHPEEKPYPLQKEADGLVGPWEVQATAFSLDGRVLAVGQGSRVLLWDLATAKELGALTGHAGPVLGLAFSADGRRLLSSSADTTVVLWDLEAAMVAPPPLLEEVTEEDRLKCWKDLLDEDANTAHRAIWKLTGAGEPTVGWLKSRLRPARRVEPLRIAKLITQLDDRNFADREAAAAELESLGFRAAAPLKGALGKNPSLEVRQRIEALLTRINKKLLSADLLRQIRAVQVIDRIGTLAARKLLQELAGGAPEEPLTQEAKAAVARHEAR